ncbi:OmpA family protein [Alteromonas pelagimontana]|uniref:OmpA family protein n=1 Tax=Alteromonas pelagimontana TaxID=1858656 RepID=A0A6M4MGH4_9ALTE|nr:OmpA family protein [Alteromonas pelagimontana]QJR82162.1 OmpA family protein [Alteromonas pelagimontana]
MNEQHDLLEDEGAGYLISVADMMSGLLLVFIITLVAFILNFQDAIQKQEKVTETQKTIVRKLTNREQIRTQLLLEIKETLATQDIIVEVDTEHGVLRLTEQAVLFESSEVTLNETSKTNLEIISMVMSSILPCYSSNPPENGLCVNKSELEGTLDSVFVEGHTDNVPMNSWRYKDNWDLSAQRAISAYRHVMQSPPLLNMENASGQPIFSVSGYGEGRPVEGHAHDVPTNDPVNRRIDIRFTMAPPTLTDAQRSIVEAGAN